MNTKKIIFSSVCAALTAVNFNLMAQGPQSTPPIVAVAQVGGIEQGSSKRNVGYIEPIEEVDLQPRVSGFLKTINYKEGDIVKKGDKLIEIEDTTYKAQAMAAKANLDQMKAELKYAEDNFARKDALTARQVAAIADKDEAVRLLELGKAKVAAAEAELMNAENELSYTTIYAPITGRIGKTSVTEGNYVTAQSPALNKIVMIDPIYIRIPFSGRDFLWWKQKQTNEDNVELKVFLSDGTEYSAPWEIGLIDNVIDKSTDTIDVWFSFANPDGKLVPGGYVTVTVTEKADAKTPAVPVSALLNDADGVYVFVIGNDKKAERRNIKTGYTVGDKITVSEGLAIGETIVVDGTHKIMASGMTVEPVTLENK